MKDDRQNGPRRVRALLADSTLSYSDIAKAVGLSRERVRQIAASCGAPSASKRRKARQSAQAELERIVGKVDTTLLLWAWTSRGECVDNHAVRCINRYLANMGMFRCPTCKLAKLLAERSPGTGGRPRAGPCKACSAARVRDWTARFKSRDPSGYKAYVKHHNAKARAGKIRMQCQT